MDRLLLRIHSGLRLEPASPVSVVTRYGLLFRRASQVYLLVTVLKPRLSLLVPMRGVSRAADLQLIVAVEGKLRVGFHEAGEAGR